jgi:hypothetical protein
LGARQRARQSRRHPDCRSTTIKSCITKISLALAAVRDNHHPAATAEMAILIVAVFPSRLSRHTGAVKVGRRANLAAYSTLPRPHLDSFEHDGTAWCGSDDDDQRGARLRARINRATTLYSVGPRTQTMMQSCASAAKLRSGGPILPFGMKAKGPLGIPPPRTVIGVPSQAYGQGRNCRGTFSVLRSLCRTQNDAVRDNALPHEPPQGDQ